MSDTIHRFLWGYGADGYCILARSAGLPSELASEVRALFEAYDFSELRPSLVSGQLDGHLVLCSAHLRKQPGKRASWERAFVLVPMRSFGTAGMDSLLQLLPDSSLRGELPPPLWPPPPEQALTLEPDEERSLAALWAAALRGQTVLLQGYSPEQEQRLCSALWQRIPPAHRRLLGLGLGLSTVPATELRSTIYSVEEPSRAGDVVISRDNASVKDDQQRSDLLRHFYVQYVQPLVASPEPTGDSRSWWLRWSESVVAVLPGSVAELCQPAVFSNVALADRVAAGRPIELALAGDGTPQNLGVLGGSSRIFIAWLVHHCRDRAPAELFRIVRELSRLLLAVPGEGAAGVIDRMGDLLLEAATREALAPAQDPGSLAERFAVEHTAAYLIPETQDATLCAVHAAVWSAATSLLGKLARQGNPCVVRELQIPWPDAPRRERTGWLRRLFSRSPDPETAAETPAVLLQRWLDDPFTERGAAKPPHVDARIETLSPGPESPLVTALTSDRGDKAVQSLIRGLVHTAYAARRQEQRDLLTPAIHHLLHNLSLSKNRAESPTAEDKSHAS